MKTKNGKGEGEEEDNEDGEKADGELEETLKDLHQPDLCLVAARLSTRQLVSLELLEVPCLVCALLFTSGTVVKESVRPLTAGERLVHGEESVSTIPEWR